MISDNCINERYTSEIYTNNNNNNNNNNVEYISSGTLEMTLCREQRHVKTQFNIKLDLTKSQWGRKLSTNCFFSPIPRPHWPNPLRINSYLFLIPELEDQFPKCLYISVIIFQRYSIF